MPVFTANVPGVLQIGDRIEIGGKIKENARKMSVNLCAQEGEEPRDVVLHFDVRFHRDNIISLSRKNGIWIGSGNYDTNYNMFVPGTIFRIIFEIKDTDVITIYCQGKFHSNFLPKIPLTMAKFIVAWADVERITHCYFQMGQKGEGVSQGVDVPECSPALFSPTSPRAMVAGDGKRCSPRMLRRKAKESPQLHSSQESSEDDETVKARPKAEGRADKFFYETLMCQPKDHGKYSGSPESAKFRSPSQARCRTEYARKYRDDNDSEYSEDLPPKNMDSSQVDSEDVLLDKKNRRRGKFPFAQQMVNFMGKNGKRN